ncbi:autotransporter outer membrane beta-barrel domain-containing protein [Sphingomonas quercus]|uniref:Autotransporter outer membrane beta-barrel domain-containing protein n=1 Tax=Sphingomonas quercus TaxID=2842451 RepID=A0ABS6BJI7_9SPHN|nr:autotransporter outer membrane beta-barrel domain-containing protein [Sphingomonas quercus]MBU3077782.1 autotransporter outer membrane beta-barrel domain-containing protein [Sphingomonas quercus]
MRRLLASTCFLAIAAPLHAETTITTKVTNGVQTSKATASGSADDIRITSDGSVIPTGGTPVLIDSANKFTNQGTVQITNVDGASAVLGNAGTGGDILNSAKIIVNETYTATDTDKDGDLDGPYAAGTGRAGIRTLGAYNGSITNDSAGSIAVNGNDSYGVRLGGKLNGNFTNNGTITVVGDRGTAISLGEVSGAVRLAGTASALGAGATAARIGGTIGGALVVQGTLTATGYRDTTGTLDATKLDADDLLQGGSALVVAGDVAGGIILAVPPKDNSTTDNDEDKDGLTDSTEGSAAVTAYGAAPAIVIGAADRSVSIGPVAGTGTGFGLVIDGAVTGSGVYAGVDATGIAVGGLGQAASIAGGIGVNGTVTAISNGANATAISIRAGGATPEIRIAGTVAASGGGTAATKATAIAVEAGAAVPTIRVSGKLTATAGAGGTAIGIVDRSGTVKLIENSGAIAATGATAGAGRNLAIDLSATTTGTIVRQTAVASTATAPAIIGDVRFGSGDDVFELADGTITGDTSFGAGKDRLTLSGDAAYAGSIAFGADGGDRMELSGTSVYQGRADFGGGADTLSVGGTARFNGQLVNAQALNVAITGGTLQLTNTGNVAIGSLAVTGGGTLAVTLDRSNQTIVNVAGTASFAADSKVAVKLTSLDNAEGRYVILRAGTLTGAANIGSTTTLLPFLYKGNVVTSAANELSVDIIRKTTDELGLNRSQASAYSAIYAALANDGDVAKVFLNQTDGDGFRAQLRQMLPEHAGGTFEAVTSGSRALARMLADPKGPFKDEGRWGYWLQQVGFGRSKSVGDTAGYDVTGWGLAGGAEYKTGFGNVGVSLAYLWGREADAGTNNEVDAGQFEVAAYWRAKWNGLQANARVAAGTINFDSERDFNGTVGSDSVARNADGKWNGRLVSASGAVSYESWLGMISLRPIVAVDYYRLHEGGYTETGGGKAFDLIVDSRNSDELAVTGSVAAGLDFGGAYQDDGWFRIELEGGRREIVGGGLGVTTARFEGGQSFRLTPEDRTNGWVGRVRAIGGNASFRLGGEFGAEQQQGRPALSLRATLQIGL